MLLDCIFSHLLCIFDAINHTLYISLSLSYHIFSLSYRGFKLIDVHVEQEALKNLIIVDSLLLFLEYFLHRSFLFIELLVSDHQLVEIFSLRIILLQFFILNSDPFFQNLVFVGEIFQVVLDARIFVQAGFV